MVSVDVRCKYLAVFRLGETPDDQNGLTCPRLPRAGAQCLLLGSSVARKHRPARGFDHAFCERVPGSEALAGTFAKFTLNPAMNQLIVSVGGKLQAEATPFDTM